MWGEIDDDDDGDSIICFLYSCWAGECLYEIQCLYIFFKRDGEVRSARDNERRQTDEKEYS